MGLLGWIILIIVNIPVYFVLGKLFFPTWEDFKEAVLFWITPDIISAFRGEFWEDWWAELKLGWWLLSCILFVIGESYLIGKVFG